MTPIVYEPSLNENYFPGFSHASTEIIRFKETIEFFSVMLATGQVIPPFSCRHQSFFEIG